MATEWVAVTEALVSDAMPSDLAPLYATWLSTYPAKAGTLARIVGDTVAQVRTAIRTNPANTLDDDATKIPQDLRPACYDLITHRLAMEMGIDLESSANQVRQDADQLLRMVAYRHWIVESEDNTRSPIYNAPTTGQSSRTALPSLIALALCFFAGPARAAWVNGTTVSDANVLMTYVATNYTAGANTLFGHAGGIDAKLRTLGGTQAVAEAYSAATAAVAQAATAYTAATAALALASSGAATFAHPLPTGTVDFAAQQATNIAAISFVGGVGLTEGSIYIAQSVFTNGLPGFEIGANDWALDTGNGPNNNGLGWSGDLALFGATNGDFLIYRDGWWQREEGVNIASYYTVAQQQAAITNVLRFLTTTTAPASNTASGSRGEIRKDSTNLYLHDGTSWGRFPGNWGTW